jgi:hypothetical protein
VDIAAALSANQSPNKYFLWLLHVTWTWSCLLLLLFREVQVVVGVTVAVAAVMAEYVIELRCCFGSCVNFCAQMRTLGHFVMCSLGCADLFFLICLVPLLAEWQRWATTTATKHVAVRARRKRTIAKPSG